MAFSYDLNSVPFRFTRLQSLILALISALLFSIILLLVAILVVILVYDGSSNNTISKKEFGAEEIRDSIFANIKSERIAQNLHEITKKPHQAGTEANREVAEKIAQIWTENGLEDVHFIEYKALLNYPDFSSPNHVSVLGLFGQTMFRTTGISPDLFKNDTDPTVGIQWLAYSAAGTVEGQVVYCNYGRKEDFERLAEFGIHHLKGKIALMRYGNAYRGDKVRNAQEYGAIGAIVYSDPAECAMDGIGPEHVFPATDWMPPTGVQRGSLMEANGDPLTPLLPSRKDFHAEKTVEQLIKDHAIPAIPAVPLSYGDAYHILSRMDGPKVPKGWQGGLNFTYRIGPNFQLGKGQRVRLEVKSTNEIRSIQNVIGYIVGSDYPDEWVILGNHYDAWVYGAIDPNSGTAILAEVAKGFAETMKATGWRPKRTIVFCAWDAEEYSLIGSTEFVEEFANVLSERAILYINVDNISGNQTLSVSGVPTLFRAATNAAKLVRHPLDENAKIYDIWKRNFPTKNSFWLPEDVPKIGLVGSGSDDWNFLNLLGIPVIHFSYINRNRTSGYPLYHTRYETPFLNEHLIDRNNLAVHKAVGEYWAELARSFADSPLLPFSVGIFARTLLKDYFESIKKPIMDLSTKFPDESGPAQQQLEHLLRTGELFALQAVHFENVWNVSTNNIEWANRRLRKLDRCFINPAMGLAREERMSPHVLYSLSNDNKYASTVLAAVNKRIFQFEMAESKVERTEAGRALALELTVVQQAVRCAINTLKGSV